MVKQLTQSLAAQIVAEHKDVSKVNPVASNTDNEKVKSVRGQKNSDRSFGKRKTNETDLISIKKPKVERKAQSPAGAVGSRYAAFFEVVVKGATKEANKVTCILCTDGKIYSYSSMWRHIRAIHTSPEKCDICGQEFNIVQLRSHKRKWHNLKFEEENNNVKSSDVKVVQVSPPTSEPCPTAPPKSLQGPNSSSLPASASHTSSGKNNDDPSSLAGGYISITMTSATKGVSLKMAVREDVRIKKAMKKFAKKFNVDYRSLTFLVGSHKLTGAELVAELGGTEIDVVGELSK